MASVHSGLMVEVVIVEPGELAQSDLDAAEALVRAAFGDSFRTHDWLHGVDGVHVLTTEGGELLAHASVVTRTLRHGTEAFAAGYVEGGAVVRSSGLATADWAYPGRHSHRCRRHLPPG